MCLNKQTKAKSYMEKHYDAGFGNSFLDRPQNYRNLNISNIHS